MMFSKRRNETVFMKQQEFSADLTNKNTNRLCLQRGRKGISLQDHSSGDIAENFL